MVSNLEYSSPLDKIDHCVIVFDFIWYTRFKAANSELYTKGNYQDFNGELETIGWDSVLNDGDDLNLKWDNFKNKLTNMENKYTPTKSNNNVKN